MGAEYTSSVGVGKSGSAGGIVVARFMDVGSTLDPVAHCSGTEE